MLFHPVEIRRNDEDSLTIKWSDGKSGSLTGPLLRRECPCAMCRIKRGDTSHDQPIPVKRTSLLKIIEHTKDEEVAIKSLWQIGGYAIGIEWGDGHNSGIYSYSLLRSLHEF
jgi:DUF971 family protein